MFANIKIFIKYIPYLIIIGLVIALSVSQCSRQKVQVESNDKVFEAVLKSDKARINALEATSKALKLKLKEDSVKAIASQTKFVKEIKSLKVKLAYARTRVIPLLDSIPELDRFVDLSDSTISVQDARIDSLSAEKSEMWAKFNALIASAEEKNKVQIELNSHYQDLNKQLDKQIRRERTKKTAWKLVSGILAGGLIAKSLNVF